MSTIYRAATLVAAIVIATPSAAQLTEGASGIIEEAAPKPPVGVAPTYTTPSRDAAGMYTTPNRNLSPEESVWHVRVALNVAALGCRDSAEAQTVAAYNAILANQKVVLAAVSNGVTAQYKVKFGSAAQSRYDDNMTRLYNFFAQPPAQQGFCAVAKDILRESATIEPAAFAAFAAAALPRIEAPFTAFFASYDGYRTALATWQARTGPRLVIATAAAAPVAMPVAARIGAGEP